MPKSQRRNEAVKQPWWFPGDRGFLPQTLSVLTTISYIIIIMVFFLLLKDQNTPPYVFYTCNNLLRAFLLAKWNYGRNSIHQIPCLMNFTIPRDMGGRNSMRYFLLQLKDQNTPMPAFYTLGVFWSFKSSWFLQIPCMMDLTITRDGW